MIVIKLLGGLGNQLFQYAAGRALALRTQQRLGLDCSWFELQTTRKYRLDHFNIEAEIASGDDIAPLRASHIPYLPEKLVRGFRRVVPFWERRYFQERPRQFNPDILKISAPAYLEGYWQSEEYFEEFATIIRQDLTFRQAPDPKNQNFLNQITGTNSVSLHVRRGDYVSDPVIAQNFRVCSFDYYRRAAERIASAEADPHYFIFSDDLGWARKHIRLEFPVTFVGHNGPEKDYEDLRLMSHCRHHIIANSSFSWWGAWLASHSQKIVLAPQRWFRDETIDASYLVPDRWIRL